MQFHSLLAAHDGEGHRLANTTVQIIIAKDPENPGLIATDRLNILTVLKELQLFTEAKPNFSIKTVVNALLSESCFVYQASFVPREVKVRGDELAQNEGGYAEKRNAGAAVACVGDRNGGVFGGWWQLLFIKFHGRTRRTNQCERDGWDWYHFTHMDGYRGCANRFQLVLRNVAD